VWRYTISTYVYAYTLSGAEATCPDQYGNRPYALQNGAASGDHDLKRLFIGLDTGLWQLGHRRACFCSSNSVRARVPDRITNSSVIHPGTYNIELERLCYLTKIHSTLVTDAAAHLYHDGCCKRPGVLILRHLPLNLHSYTGDSYCSDYIYIYCVSR
jgi:hypothetical protein